MTICNVRESVVMSCGLMIRLMHPYGKALLGLMQRTVFAHAAGSDGFRGRLEGVAPKARGPALAPEARSPA